MKFYNNICILFSWFLKFHTSQYFDANIQIQVIFTFHFKVIQPILQSFKYLFPAGNECIPFPGQLKYVYPPLPCYAMYLKC